MTRLASTWRFSHAFGPARIRRKAPTVGSTAHQPGNGLSSVIVTSATAMRTKPRIESQFDGRASLRGHFDIAYASALPTISSHARESGE